MDFNLIQHQQIQENADILSDQEEAYELDDPESSAWNAAVNQVVNEIIPFEDTGLQQEFEEDDFPTLFTEETVSYGKSTTISTINLGERFEDLNLTAGAVGASSSLRTIKTGRRGRPRIEVMTPEQEDMLGQANAYYAQGEDEKAVELFTRVIQENPQVTQAWLSLAMICEEKGNYKKALLMKYCAAERARDPDLWIELGYEFRSENLISQSALCFTKASKLRPDRDILKIRLELHKQIVGSLHALLAESPYDTDALAQITEYYVKQRQFRRAIFLYTRLMNDCLPPEGPREPFAFGWNEANILTELHIESGNFATAINVIKHTARRLQQRGIEGARWDLFQGDEEYNESSPLGASLPLDLRIKLGYCRMMLDEYDLAKQHFSYILNQPVEGNADLYHIIGESYLQKQFYREALDIYIRIKQLYPLDVNCRVKLAECFHLLGDMENAIRFLSEVLSDTNDIKVKEKMASLYEEIGEQDLAIRLYSEVSLAREQLELREPVLIMDKLNLEAHPSGHYSVLRKRAHSQREEEYEDADEEGEKPHFLFFKRDSTKTSERKNVILSESRQFAEETIKGYMKVYELLASKDLTILDSHNLFRYLEASRAMFEDFTSKTQFFSSSSESSKRKSQGFNNDDDLIINTTMNSKEDKCENHYYRGKNMNEWMWFCLKFAKALTLYGLKDDAFNVLKKTRSCTFYRQNPDILVFIRLVEAAVALKNDDYNMVYDVARWLNTVFPLRDQLYQLYTVLFLCKGGGSESLNVYASNRAQRYFRRQLQYIEALNSASNEQGSIHSSILMALYGNILQSAHSYTLAAACFSNACCLQPKDPLNYLSLCVAYAGHAMQKTCVDRHWLILQSFAAFEKYADSHQKGKDSVEVVYNLARLYHQLGIFYLAVKKYMQVLEKIEKDYQENESESTLLDQPLCGEAAYNLHLIYLNSGSPQLAKDILFKYCVI